MRTIGRLILTAVFALLTAALVAAAVYVPGFFAFYTPFSQSVLAFLAGVTEPFPFAVWQVLLVLLGLLGLYTLVRTFSKKRGFLCWLAGLLCTFSLFMLVFTALWGLNHWGPSVADRLGLEIREYSRDELRQTTQYLADQASAWAGQVEREPDTDMAIDLEAMAKTAGASYEALARRSSFFAGSSAPVKTLLAGKAFSYMGITGIFICFTGESGINPDTYPASLPYTMCHEAAHRLTVAPEDEANFCAFLACSASDDPAFRYSGYYSAFIHCYNALNKTDREAAAQIWDSLDAAVVSDLRRANQHYEQYEGVVQEAASKVNDTYLKAFNEESGVQSYGEAADLLIAWYLQMQSA